MANKNMKRCLISLLIREWQTKTLEKYIHAIIVTKIMVSDNIQSY